MISRDAGRLDARDAPSVDGVESLKVTCRVTMRDGVRLATDVYFQADVEKPSPVILVRTPYGRHTSRPLSTEHAASYFLTAGFAYVAQDCRGCGDSEGTFRKFADDGVDGYDTVVWLGEQSWCNGQILTTGVSYCAHVQAAMASLTPPHLAGMLLDSGGNASAYHEGVHPGGAFELKQAFWAVSQAKVSPAAVQNPLLAGAIADEDWEGWVHALPWRSGASPLRFIPEYEEMLFEMWDHDRFDSYWTRVGYEARHYYGRFPDVPTLHMSSWYDPFRQTAIWNYRGLSQVKKSAAYLILGPWTHADSDLSYAGDVDFGSSARLSGNLADDYMAYQRQWFDYCLGKTEEYGPRVRYFVMGGGTGAMLGGKLDHGGRWQTSSEWPPDGISWKTLYLRQDGSITSTPPIEKGEMYVEFDFDPHKPVPTIGGAFASYPPVLLCGAFDQVEDPRFFGCEPPYLPLLARPDVLVFQTEPLPKAVLVAGPISAHLWISSNCLDTDFTIKLIDVYPPCPDYPGGFAMNITDGILRCRFRDSWQEPSLLVPDHIYEITVEAPDTANVFKAGHRIRLDISSSNFPRFDVNNNTGEPTMRGRRKLIATNRVYINTAHPSSITLPILSCGE